MQVLQQGALQGCNGLSLMMGYTNPWAAMVRKQCESSVALVQGFYQIVLSMLIYVPFTKCMCVDAAKGGTLSFAQYSIENCYFFAPDSMKPMMLDTIQDALRSTSQGGVQGACTAMMQHTTDKLSSSMDDYFTLQFQTTQQLASSLDFLFRVFDADPLLPGKCMSFELNPYATVLIPEPVDYFAACGSTTLCESKCRAEFSLFKEELARVSELRGGQAPTTVSVVKQQQESLFFLDLDEDAYTPMKILAMVELSRCDAVCGGGAALADQNGGASAAGEQDSCMAIAGISSNRTLAVKKYCIPGSLGTGVWSEPSETWHVWHSEGWIDTVVQVFFTETMFGDSLAVHQDNRAGGLRYSPRGHFVSLQSRALQRDPAVWDFWYSTEWDRGSRLVLASLETPIAGADDSIEGGLDHLAMPSVHVVPQGEEGRAPMLWVLVLGASRQDPDYRGVLYDTSTQVQACGVINVGEFASSSQASPPPQAQLQRCNLDGFFTIASQSGYVPVTLKTGSPTVCQLLLVPTVSGSDRGQDPPLQLADVELSFGLAGAVAAVRLTPIESPPDLVLSSKLPTTAPWIQAARAVASGSTMYLSTGEARMAYTQEKVTVSVGKVLAQNTHFSLAEAAGTGGEAVVLISNDPDSPTHWLGQLRILLKANGPAAGSGWVAQDVSLASSKRVDVTVTLLHSCDKTSCLGCPTLRLQTLCYAAQQCSVVRCIGTVVNEMRPLCNAGLELQALADTALSMLHASWRIFVETYVDIFRASLQPQAFFAPGSSVDLEWVDDNFFGTVCTAKDAVGQGVALLTSVIGKVLADKYNLLSRVVASGAPAPEDAGVRRVDSKFTALLTMQMAGLNSFLYQLFMAPLYFMIAQQKIMVCNANSVLALIGESGFSVTVGRRDLQRASDVSSGQCLTAGYEAAFQDSGSQQSSGAASGVAELMLQRNPGTSKVVGLMQSSRMLNGIGARLAGMQLKTPMHLLDSVITYFMGVVSGMQDLVQSLDRGNCHVPDLYMDQVTRCACGDDALTIPDIRQQDSAYWCTGTLRMLDSFGKVVYVYNPHSYAALKDALRGKLDPYLQCLSLRSQGGTGAEATTDQQQWQRQSCSDLEPKLEAFTRQFAATQVSLVAVFQQCKANYQQKQWDEGAFLIHDRSALERYITVEVPEVVQDANPETARCLLSAEARREPNTGCMLDHIRQGTDAYFLLEKLAAPAEGGLDSVDIDACLVFSGPARHADPAVAETFQNCSSDYANQDGCRIPHTVWSANSRNKVPVASLHSTRDNSLEARRRTADGLMDAAHQMAMRALEGVKEFDDPELELLLFSGEGDSLHQIFDCIVQGPYARVNLWARGQGPSELPGPSWARDAGGAGRSRRMDLPCIGSKLQGDSRPPFTCGGNTRRAIIKYFVRRYINGKGDGKGNTALAVKMVRSKVAELLQAWQDKTKYACACGDGRGNSLDCCRVVVADSLEDCATGAASTVPLESMLQQSFLSDEFTQAEGGKVLCTSHFLPPSLHVQFDEISGDKVVEEIIRQIPAYLQSIFTDDSAEAFKLYNSKEEVASWDWTQSEASREQAAAHSLYTTYRPLVNYTGEEAGYPFRFRRSLWTMCAGLVSQVMFTMPLRPAFVQDAASGGEGDWMWTAAGAMAESSDGEQVGPPFDPVRAAGSSGEEDTATTGNGLSALETHVRALLRPSFLGTSTFWHYAMRHVPSDSLVCAREASRPASRASSFIRYANKSPEFPLLNMSRVPSIKLKGYDHGSLGEAGVSCFCGWDSLALGNGQVACTVPAQVCASLPEDLRSTLPSPCAYHHGTRLADETLLPAILEMWAAEASSGEGWQCPSMELSDGWGLVSNEKANDWILSKAGDLEVRVASLAHSGRAGLMLGNVDTLEKQAAREGVWPSSREHPLVAAEAAGSNNKGPGGASSVPAASLRVCASRIMSTFDPASLVQDVVDDLFPAAQAVHEPAPMSVCLRYVTEYAKLRLIELMAAKIQEEDPQRSSQGEPPPRIQDELRAQQAAASLWRIKCEAQLDLLGVCSSNGVFRMIPDPQVPQACPYAISDPYTTQSSERRWYVTPGCLLYVSEPGQDDGAFFDPCRMPSRPCGALLHNASSAVPSLGLQGVLDHAEHTLLPFDPRRVGSEEALGAWPVDFQGSSPAGPAGDEALEAAASRLVSWRSSGTQVPWRLSEAFVAHATDPDARLPVGNAKGAHSGWAKAEGFANETAEFCDGIADWWPEDWNKPVGYHVTVPCNKQHTGYRTFDAAFAVDRGTDEEEGDILQVVTMRYHHTMLRDPSLYHNRFGASGFCRSGTYGMPMFVTNTMRVCTRDAHPSVQYDAAVPVKPRYGASPSSPVLFSDEEFCSDSPEEVPWSLDDRTLSHPAMFAVGNVPMYRGDIPDPVNGKYPSEDRRVEHANTHPGTLDRGWGQSCTDGNLLSCSADADCVATAAGVAMACIRGVCVLKPEGTACYRHKDCEAQDMLCAGDGRCVKGVWQMENSFRDIPVDFELYAAEASGSRPTCGAGSGHDFPTDRYDMYGASPWQTVPDILRMYGMCSYRDWFEYLELVNGTSGNGACGTLSAAVGCEPEAFSADLAKWWETSRSASLELRTIWETSKFRVLPHPCDRDYMHLQGMRGCSPVVYGGNRALGILSMSEGRAQDWAMLQAPRSRLARTISRADQARVQALLANLNASPLTTATEVQLAKAIVELSINFGQVTRFLNTVGRPPYDRLGADYRKFGFMGMKSMPDSAGGGEASSTFRNCSLVPQCRKDPFTFNGKPVDHRTVVSPTKPLSTSSSEPAKVRAGPLGEEQEVPLPGAWSYDPASADRCGGFGFEVDATKYAECQGVSDKHCCVLDRSVLPLYEALCTSGATTRLTVKEDMYDVQNGRVEQGVAVELGPGNTVLDYLDRRCNYYLNPFSPQWQSWMNRLPLDTRYISTHSPGVQGDLQIFSKQAMRDSVCPRIPRVYTTRKSSTPLQRKRDTLNEIRDKLNGLWDAMTPKVLVDSADRYMQVSGCAAAMYGVLQAVTECPAFQGNIAAAASTSSTDQLRTLLGMNPYCTQYHRPDAAGRDVSSGGVASAGSTTAGVTGSIAASASAKSPAPRSGFYYALAYTVQEVPFAWWRTCMMMQSRTFASSMLASSMGGTEEGRVQAIMCDDWDKQDASSDSITQSEMLAGGSAVLAWLKRMRGGIRGADLVSRYVEHRRRVLERLGSYLGSSSSSPVSASLAKTNLADDYGVQCRTGLEYIPVAQMKKIHETTPYVDCEVAILKWTFTWSASPDTFLSGQNLYGVPGVPKQCYRVDPASEFAELPFYPQGRVLPWIQRWLFGSGTRQLTVPNDYAKDRSQTSPLVTGGASGVPPGLVVGELFVPAMDLPPPIDSYVRSNEKPTFTLLTETDGTVPLDTAFSKVPCIELQSVEKRLDVCQGIFPERALTNEHCDAAYERTIATIKALAKKITSPTLVKPPGIPDALGTNPSRLHLYEGDLELYAGMPPWLELDSIQEAGRQRLQCKERVKEARWCYKGDLYHQAAVDFFKGRLGASIGEAPSYSGASAQLSYEKSYFVICSSSVLDYYDETVCDPYPFVLTTGNVDADYYLMSLWNQKVHANFAYYEWVYQSKQDNKYNPNRETIRVTADMTNILGKTYTAGYDDRGKYTTVGSLSDLVFGQLVRPLFEVSGVCERLSKDRCLPPTKPLTASVHMRQGGSSSRQCFKTAIPTGRFNCSFPTSAAAGLQQELRDVQVLRGTQLETAHSRTALGWFVSNDIPSTVKEDEPFLDKATVVQAVHARMAHALLQDPGVSVCTIQPLAAGDMGSSGALFLDNKGEWLDGYEQFDVSSRLAFEDGIDRFGQDCSVNTTISYGTCAEEFLDVFNGAGSAARSSILRDGPTSVPPNHALVWPGIPLSQHLGPAVPAWSRSDRPLRHRFVEWIFDKEVQCPAGSIDNSVCARSTETGQWVAVNPWLGGSFNPWEKCDTQAGATTVDHEGVNEEISVSCHPDICADTDAPYYANQPNQQCLARASLGQTAVKQGNVRFSSASNLCRRTPWERPPRGTPQVTVGEVNPVTGEGDRQCTWPQGMLRKEHRGSPAQSLYTFADLVYSEGDVGESSGILASAGQGLFLHGGNPLYYTTKGTEADVARNVHSVLRQSLEDLGGHHVVFRTATDPISKHRFLYVDRTPLASIGWQAASPPMPAAYIYDQSLTSAQTHEPLAGSTGGGSGGQGWLRNLPAQMRADEAAVQDLYPVYNETTARSNRKWSCPLRRISFWTQVVGEVFNPVTPSPVRAQRLFGNDEVRMTFGTRAHPTQAFRSLTSLANVYTSNGFCFCKDLGDCRVSTNDLNAPCSLHQTVQSLYDKKYREVQLLLQNDTVCTRQLDWPYEGGVLRDGMPFQGIGYSEAEKCNVLDRLPSFQYRYMPSGRIHRHADARTTLDEGGSCHMGRAAQIRRKINEGPTEMLTAAGHPHMRIETRKCRTIAKNLTHIVARCDGTGGVDEVSG